MPYHVLVVDDQSMPRQLFETIVNASENYTLVASIDTASVADVYCAGRQVDLILMDVVMADGSNGLDAAARIKRSFPRVKILAVTSMPDASFLEKARRANVDSFWYKEVQDAPLLEVMDRTMEGERVYPDRAPVVSLGFARTSEFTAREMDVLRQLVQGCSDREIAERLSMSYNTERTHLKSLLQKTGCASRTELAIRAAKAGIAVAEL